MEQRSFQEFKSNIACYNFYESIDSIQARSRCPVNGKGSILGVVFASILNEQESSSHLPDGVCVPGQTGVGRYIKKSIRPEGVLDPQGFLEAFPAWEEFKDSQDALRLMGAVEPDFKPARLVGGFVLAKVNSSSRKTEGSYFISKYLY